MYRFFIKKDQIQDGYVLILGEDVNHIKNVLRMKEGDKVFLSCETDLEYECSLEEFASDKIKARILDIHGMETELGTEIILYQGLPKGDKMEFIIQKAVELGVTKIVPVRMKRCVVKLDEKKAKKKNKNAKKKKKSKEKRKRKNKKMKIKMWEMNHKERMLKKYTNII